MSKDEDFSQLEKFGEVYVNSYGEQFFRIFGSKPELKKLGVKLSIVQPFEGTVESVTSSSPWHEVGIKDPKVVFLIHHSWVISYGEIKVGDRLEGVVIVNVLPWMAWHVRRVKPQKEVIADE